MGGVSYATPILAQFQFMAPRLAGAHRFSAPIGIRCRLFGDGEVTKSEHSQMITDRPIDDRSPHFDGLLFSFREKDDTLRRAEVIRVFSRSRHSALSYD
jgi:hypothetical protein